LGPFKQKQAEREGEREKERGREGERVRDVRCFAELSSYGGSAKKADTQAK
jgi:hypothetical protein